MFKSLRLEHEMHDGTSDMNVFEYLWLRKVSSHFGQSHAMNTKVVTFLTAKDMLCRQEQIFYR